MVSPLASQFESTHIEDPVHLQVSPASQPRVAPAWNPPWRRRRGGAGLFRFRSLRCLRRGRRRAADSRKLDQGVWLLPGFRKAPCTIDPRQVLWSYITLHICPPQVLWSYVTLAYWQPVIIPGLMERLTFLTPESLSPVQVRSVKRSLVAYNRLVVYSRLVPLTCGPEQAELVIPSMT